MVIGRPAPDWLARTTYAHRGLHTADAPENSLAAAKNAQAAGLGIECDIQRSSDGTPFVFHDWDLDRLTGESGSFADRSDSELQALTLLGSDETPPTLARFLEVVAGRAPVLIEIKSRAGYDIVPSCVSVLSALEAYSGPNAVMSFDPRVPGWFKDNAPSTYRGLVGTDSLPNGFEHVWRSPNIIENCDPDFLAIDRRDLAQAGVADWRAKGLSVLSWTIKTKEDWHAAQGFADALIAEGDALA